MICENEINNCEGLTLMGFERASTGWNDAYLKGINAFFTGHVCSWNKKLMGKNRDGFKRAGSSAMCCFSATDN
jgi:hypothetical protein